RSSRRGSACGRRSKFCSTRMKSRCGRVSGTRESFWSRSRQQAGQRKDDRQLPCLFEEVLPQLAVDLALARNEGSVVVSLHEKVIGGEFLDLVAGLPQHLDRFLWCMH